MREFTKLETNGYVFYGRTKLDLSYKGLTVIHAQNLDARKSAEATNGAGKSLLLGLIPDIFFDAVPSGKDVQTRQTSDSGAVEFRAGKHFYRIERTWGRKKKIRVFQDGTDLNLRTLSLATQRIQTLLGLTEEEFYSTSYIDVNRPHPLIRGTSAKRQEYFTSMFRLHDTDALRKLLLQNLRECETAGTTYKEILEQYRAIKGETSADRLKLLQSKVSVIKNEAADLQRVTNELNSLKELFDYRDRYAGLIKRVERITEVKETHILKTKNELSSRVSQLKKDLASALEYEAERKTFRKAKARIEKAHERLKIFGLTTSLKKAKKGAKLFNKYEPKFKEAHTRLLSLVGEVNNLKDEKKTLGLDDTEADKTSQKILDKLSSYEEKLVLLEHELKHSKLLGSGTCPTCGQSVDTRKREDIEHDIQRLKKKLNKGKSLKKGIDLDNKIKEKNQEIEVLKSEVKILKNKVNKFERYAKAYDTLRSVPELPEFSLSKPKASKEECESQLEKLEDKLQVLVQAEPVAALLEKSISLGSKDEQRFQHLKQEACRLEKISTKLAVLESRVKIEAEKLKSLKEMRDRALELKEKAQDVPILKSLLEVYSNKGLKKLMIQRYASVIEKQLNKFRSLLFSEDFTFELKYDTQFHILVHRRYNKKIKTSDVRKLSGAEGRAFTLLLLLATLALIPKSRRLNFLVLDEADSNMGPDQFKNFLRFIPVLNKVIPHIIILTPKTDVVYEGARVFTVVKQDGKSKLVRGKPVCA